MNGPPTAGAFEFDDQLFRLASPIHDQKVLADLGEIDIELPGGDHDPHAQIVGVLGRDIGDTAPCHFAVENVFASCRHGERRRGQEASFSGAGPGRQGVDAAGPDKGLDRIRRRNKFGAEILRRFEGSGRLRGFARGRPIHN